MMSLQVATILVRVRHFDREGLQLQMADLHSSSVLYTLTEIVATCKLNITLVQWRDKRQAKKTFSDNTTAGSTAQHVVTETLQICIHPLVFNSLMLTDGFQFPHIHEESFAMTFYSHKLHNKLLHTPSLIQCGPSSY